jgi:hypothetical protein
MTQQKDKPDQPVADGAKALDRRQRQAEALRRNLQRRKAQARQRDSGPDEDSPERTE